MTQAQGVTQNVSVGEKSKQSLPFGGNTRTIRIVSDTDCWYSIGTDPTASVYGTNSSSRLPADVVEEKSVAPGSKIAVVQNSVPGILNVEEGL